MSELIKSDNPKQVRTMQSALLETVQRSDVDPDKMEKLFNLHMRMKGEQAVESFNQAMNLFQAECPIITKKKKVSYGKTEYSFAPLDEIVFVIKPILAKYGLSFTFDIDSIDKDQSQLTTLISHVDGHSRASKHFFIPIADGGQMSQNQRIKSALSYAKRAGLENALGIVAQGEDDDARRSSDDGMISAEQVIELRDLCLKIDNGEERVLAFMSNLRKIKIESLSELDVEGYIKALALVNQKIGA